MQRRKLFVANWKMNKTVSESIRCATELKNLLSGKQEHEVVICPPFTSLSALELVLQEVSVFTGAQNMHALDSGAFTGEVSPRMLVDVGCDYVILGHSERRQMYAENEESLSKKIKAALDHGLIPIYCVGESDEQNQAGQSFDVIEQQLQNALRGLSHAEGFRLVVAYEPIWAIGTGRSASPDWADKIHAFIREKLAVIFTKDVANSLRILYGGSVNQDNIGLLMDQENIDGALVGGASLDAKHFTSIVKYGDK
ncbi:triose-phosphate isomerase [bacterium]|nr:triose-phosphate isomerase [bacterium]